MTKVVGLLPGHVRTTRIRLEETERGQSVKIPPDHGFGGRALSKSGLGCACTALLGSLPITSTSGETA